MNDIQRAESTLLRQKLQLQTRRQDFDIAEKAGRDTAEIGKQIVDAERALQSAETNLNRVKRRYFK